MSGDAVHANTEWPAFLERDVSGGLGGVGVG